MSTQVQNLRTGSSQTDEAPKTLMDLMKAPGTKIGIQKLASSYLPAERFFRLAVNAIRKTPRLLECDPTSVIGALMTAVALGLEPNTIQQQAYLIPYKKRALVRGKWIDTYECQFQIGYRGFITLSHRSNHIAKIEADAIHENDTFEHMQGTESFLRYKKSLTNRGKIIGAFCYVKLTNGNEMSLVLPIDEVNKIKSKSETFNSLVRGIEESDNDKDRAKAQKKLDETPWVLWEDDMAAKSAIKKMAKFLPITPGETFSAASQIDADNESGNVIDLSAMADPDRVKDVLAGEQEIPEIDHESQDEEGLEIKPMSMKAAETVHAQESEATEAPASFTARSASRRRAPPAEDTSGFGGLE